MRKLKRPIRDEYHPEVVKKEIERLDKVIAKTDKLIEKSNKQKIKETTSQLQPIVKATLPRLQKQCEVSKIDYLCLKKFPKQIMDILVQKSIHKGSYLECVIDVQEIKEITGKNSKTVRDAFYRLKKRGFFLEIHSSSNGMRVIHLNSSIYC